MKCFSVACLLLCVIGTAAQGRGQGGRTGQGPRNGDGPKGRGQGGRGQEGRKEKNLCAYVINNGVASRERPRDQHDKRGGKRGDWEERWGEWHDAAFDLPPGRAHTTSEVDLCDENFVPKKRFKVKKSTGFGPAGGQPLESWSGQADDGSELTFVIDERGHSTGSLVDPTNKTITDIFTDEDGTVHSVTHSVNDYPDEADPEDLGVGLAVTTKAKGLGRRLRSSSATRMSSSGMAGDYNIGTSLELNHRNLQTPEHTMDVLVLYTASARLAKGGTKQMDSAIALAITETNDAYAASGVNAQLRLKYAKETTYVENRGFSTALSDVRGTSDGYMDDVHALRETHKADLVALIINEPTYCGIAYLGPRTDLMFSVTSQNCMTGYYSFGHEIGHNLGCNHDKGTTNTCSSSNYNYGWRDPQANFRSIMAYNCVDGQCDNNAGGGCTRVQMFSNPNFKYNNQAIGNADNDNARRINDVAAEVDGYYISNCPLDLDCDDNNVCTTDFCSETEGICVNEDIDCDDGNPCTTNSCHPTDGCTYTAVQGCTFCGNDICEEGENTLNCSQDCAGTHTMATLDQSYWYGIKGSFIDIEVKSNDVLITGFGVDLRGSGSFSLFQRSGSGSGKTSSSSGWAQVGNTVTASGSYSHPIPGGILVPAGTKHAFHVYHTGEIEHNRGSDYPSWQYFDGNYEIDVMHAYAVPNLWSGSYYGGYQASNIRVTYEFITPTNDDDCSPNPCKNGGSCTDLVGGYSCSCPAGYSGITCDIEDSASPSAMPTPLSSDFPSTAPSSQPSEYDDCDPDPCENGGICSDGVGSYLCTCPSGFEGDRCEINITSEPSADPSSSPSKEPSLVPSLAPSLSPTGSPEVSPSASPSTPIPTASPEESPSARPSGSPEASPSSAPTNSPSQFNDCASDPCINGGTCVEFPGQGMFNCSCPLGYTGARCETNVNDCADNPCQNGNCTDEINSYMCQCDIGWEGDNCDENIDDCVDHNGSPKCLNNATCADGIDSFACTCTEDFSGDLCEIEVTREPSPTPSTSPSREPSASPTLLPSLMPSKSPTGAPTASPEASPSTAPSTAPSGPPTASPETSPSNTPSKMPTRAPTASPEASPSSGPSVMASGRPSMAPSSSPTQCNNNGDCSDGFFCNGEEICTNGVCEAGTPVSCEAGVACAVGTCNEDTDTCEYQPDDSLCDRSAFCSPQTCDINIGCQTGTDPCSTGEVCDESNDVCVECMADADCTSGESFEVASCNAGACSYICSSELCPDDGDSCTDSVCHGDGYCHNVPNGSCEPIWTTIFLNDFETGWEDFNDGGSDVARRSDGIAHSGAYAIRIRDNSDGASAMHSNDFIVSQYQGLRVEFWYYPLGMENGEDFLLEFSTDGGTSWTTAQSWARGIDFENNSWYEVSHDIDVSAIDSIRIRFRCDASQNNDRIYIDDVTFRGSTMNRNDCDPDPCLNGATCVDIGASFVCTCPPGFTGSTCETEVTETPSLSPSSSPSRVPSALPSSSPVSVPSPPPSTRPSSMSDTPSPSSIPSRSPSSTPTTAPSSSPTQCRSDTDCTSGESFEVASCNAGVCSYICSSELCPDDGDSCTDSVCHGDGYCHNVPNGSCATWQTLRFYNFDDTAGSFAGSGWNDGGGDAAIRDNIKHSGLYSLRIRDDSGSSWASSEAIDVSSYNELRVHFFFRPKNMDGAEQFHLELSTNGENFIRIRTWSVQNMVNGRWNEDTVGGIDVSSSDNIQLRFVCNGITNRDQVYLDDIKVEGK